MATLLVIEDDINTNEAICEYMKSAGHTILSALDGEEGLLLAKEPSIDLVVLDIMLPKIDGMTVLRELRKCSTVPILMPLLLRMNIHRPPVLMQRLMTILRSHFLWFC